MTTYTADTQWIADESARIKARIKRKAKAATASVLKKISADAAKWHEERRERAQQRAQQEREDAFDRHNARIATMLQDAFAAGLRAVDHGKEGWAITTRYGSWDTYSAYEAFMNLHDYMIKHRLDDAGARGRIARGAFDLLKQRGVAIPKG